MRLVFFGKRPLFFLLLLLLLLFFSSSLLVAEATKRGGGGIGGSDVVNREWRSATATYTKDTLATGVNGACGYGEEEAYGYGKKTVGVSEALFGRGSTCGGCFELRCVDHILWCLNGSPSIVVTATDFCAPNYGLPGDNGGWCNYPRRHFQMSHSSFLQIAINIKPDVDGFIPVQYRRVECERKLGGMRFGMRGWSSYFYQVLVSNVGSDGEVAEVKVKGSKTIGWITLGRNWGQNWQCDADLRGQALSFEVTTRTGSRLTSYSVAPSNWLYGQTFQGRQFLHQHPL